MYISHINECISNDIIYYEYMYVYMKCVLTNDFMRSASLDPVGLKGATWLLLTPHHGSKAEL